MIMLRGAIISGRVRDPNGQPLQSVQIGAFQVDYQNGRKMLRQVNSKQTDGRGEYRLFWLPPGDYVMATTPRRLGRGAPGPQDTQARTFYPNVLDSRSAQPIHAGEGAEVSGIDINVRPDATGKILGRVVTSLTGPNGQPALGTFYLLSTDSSTLSDTGMTTIANTSVNGATGQFELRGIVPGQYELMASVSGNGTQGWGRTRVHVTSG